MDVLLVEANAWTILTCWAAARPAEARVNTHESFIAMSCSFKRRARLWDVVFLTRVALARRGLTLRANRQRADLLKNPSERPFIKKL